MINSIDRRPKPPSHPIFNTHQPGFPSIYSLQLFSTKTISIDSISFILVNYFFYLVIFFLIYLLLILFLNFILLLFRHVLLRSIKTLSTFKSINPSTTFTFDSILSKLLLLIFSLLFPASLIVYFFI
jgi:hypothetical protein